MSSLLASGSNDLSTALSDILGGLSGGGGGQGFKASSGGGLLGSLTNLASVPATTTTQTSAKDESTASTQQSRSTTDSSKTAVQDVTMQNITDPALAMLNAIVSGSNQDPLIAQKDIAASGNLTQLQELLRQLNPEEAELRASGRVAELSRNLLENILPSIMGTAERAGTGTNALAALLSQDAAIRTGEAQSRAVEEAINAVRGQQLQASNILGSLTGGTSATTERLMQALNLSRGAVQQGQTSTTERGTSTTAGTTTTAGTSRGTSEGQQSTVDPLGWARLLNQLTLAAQPQDTSGQLLSAFMAAGGDPAALGSNMGVADFGRQAYQQNLLKTIEELYRR